MFKPRVLVRLLSAAILSASLLLAGASATMADAPPGPYSNGFESNTAGWFSLGNGGSGIITRQPSGYMNGGYATGVNSASGSGWHARVSPTACVVPAPCAGPHNRWGGYDRVFPIGGYRTYVAIYLDTTWAEAHPDARFDFSSAINNTAGAHLRDFVFNAGTKLASDLGPSGFDINASTNSQRHSSNPQNTCPGPSMAPNTCRLPAQITTSGWYTFRHTFRAQAGVLAVDMEIFNSSGGQVPGASWTVYSGDAMATVGGNRYGWFANEEIPELAIDDSRRTGLNLSLTPASATNEVGTSHTVTARATSTDTANRPSPGPGVAVEFDVIAGPNAGQTSEPLNTGCSTADCTTDPSGQVSWTYTSNGTSGTDTIRACFPQRVVVQAGDDPRTCVTATKTWGTSTGKVTGGGQIAGDPLFGLTGNLVSVPAIVPSAAGPGSQASFGFVVQSNGSPKGNLEYNDKQAGVRIKAIDITALFISSVTCGLHAEFTGTAQVIRASGTTMEDFTVEVDDCGEPGTTDTLGITTDSYANGPSTLIGGNIQIHP